MTNPVDSCVRIEAQAQGETLILPAMPGSKDCELTPARSWARVAVDCLEILEDLSELRIRFFYLLPQPPERYLATVSIRPLSLPAPTPQRAFRAPLHCAGFSQMTLAPDVAQRCCSPVSLAMTLLPKHPSLDVRALVDECQHPASGMYGVWPMTTAAAARRGRLMSIEACSSFDPLLRALASGTPVITSVRFGPGELRDAPLERTDGHLVVVIGIENNTVICHDPAAPDHNSVLRRYDATEFSRAWLAQRGATYFFADHEP
ncbi:MAG: C39 family peptidase [Pseudomonadaceae bacterium]|nr:C39 family peptidase [Pseudomonadaceae bacterium]